jgi:hypothetical protein
MMNNVIHDVLQEGAKGEQEGRLQVAYLPDADIFGESEEPYSDLLSPPPGQYSDLFSPC